MEIAERAESLAVHVIGPLVLGGAMAPQRPFGPRLGLEIGPERRIVDADLAARIDTARLRMARSVVAVDVVAPLSPAQWSMAAALNDLLQVTNHELSSFATRSRHEELLAATASLIEQIPPSQTLEEAVGRHATFSRALMIRRFDTHVSWWAGSDDFRGQPPPGRLLSWPDLRRVEVNRRPVNIVAMAEGVPVDESHYLAVLDAWLSTSPLTDLSTAYRVTPRFSWTRHTVGLVASVAGSNLALRALSHAADDKPEAAGAAIEALARSAAELPQGAPRRIAEQFTAWVGDAKAHWSEAV